MTDVVSSFLTRLAWQWVEGGDEGWVYGGSVVEKGGDAACVLLTWRVVSGCIDDCSVTFFFSYLRLVHAVPFRITQDESSFDRSRLRSWMKSVVFEYYTDDSS